MTSLQLDRPRDETEGVQIVTRTWDTPPGRTTMSVCRPLRLAGVVDHLWHSDGFILDRRERVLPNATFELVLVLGDRHGIVEGERTSVLPLTCFSGLRSRAMILD